MKKLYRLEMITHNPSADKIGYFETESAHIEVQEKYKVIAKENPDYYGEIYFEVEEIKLGIFD